jgi:nuclear pore complex protein Nup54
MNVLATKSIPEQIEQVYSKWDPARADTCVFQHYFYNYVGPERAPFYRPQPREDEKKWEEALSKKPDIGFVPALAIGFEELLKRIMTQMETLNAYNTRLHEINGCLEAMLQRHDLVISIRALDAKRRHTALSQRCLALATKVQVLRNRGYAMGGEEEDLKKKLLELEKGVFDPALGGRAEEIWARMVGIRERIRFLQGEMGRLGKKTVEVQLSEEVLKQAEKVSEHCLRVVWHRIMIDQKNEANLRTFTGFE